MPETENMQILRRMYAAWDAMALDIVFALLRPEVEFVNPEQHLWTLRDGKILELRWFHDVAEAEQAARDASRA